MLIDQNLSQLIIIDVQEKFIPVLKNIDEINKNIQKLIQASQILNIPTIVTEHYPEKLGKTIGELSKYLESHTLISKTKLSCYTSEFVRSLAPEKKQIIITGIESHVCVLQTAIELKENNFEPIIVADAVTSRSCDDKTAALERFRKLDITIVTTEMVLFEWLRCGTHPKYKEILQMLK